MQKGSKGYADMSSIALQTLLGADVLTDHKFGSVNVLFVIYQGVEQVVKNDDGEDETIIVHGDKLAHHILPENHGEEHPLEVSGQTLALRVTQHNEDLPGGLACCAGEFLFADKDTVVGDMLVARAVPLIPALPRRPEQKDDSGKLITCARCVLFDRVAGKKEFLKITHHYENGIMMMNKEIIDAMSTQYKRPSLNEENVGYCPKLEELCADISPACEDYELETAEQRDARKEARMQAMEERIQRVEQREQAGDGQAKAEG